MKRIAIAAVLCLATFAASAVEDGQWRVGVAAAFSDFEGDDSFPLDDSTTGIHISVQNQFNSWLGAEVAYLNLGGFENDVSNSNNVEISFTGMSFSALGYIPLPEEAADNIDVFGKIGYHDLDVDLNSAGIKTSLGHDTGFVVGVGASIEISEEFNIRTGFDWYDVDNSDLWSVILGLEYRF